MKIKTGLTLALILGSILVPVVNGSDCLLLMYDDGQAESSRYNPEGHQVGVLFNLPAKSARLVEAHLEIAVPGNFTVHVYDLDGNDP